LHTLRDAADYIVALPEKTSRQEHWQVAVHRLMLAAERGGIMMLRLGPDWVQVRVAFGKCVR
jgi:hypothetical protein